MYSTAIPKKKLDRPSMFENSFNNIDKEMRNEQGLASELDYAEQTSWILFLKYLDDLEQTRQDEAEHEGKGYAPILHRVSLAGIGCAQEERPD